jgi:DNA-binding PucR family transcriptional regulator
MKTQQGVIATLSNGVMDIKQMLIEGQDGCSDQHVENDIDGDGDMNELIDGLRELTDSPAKNKDVDLNEKAEPLNELELILDSQDGPEEFGEPLSEKVAAFFGKIPNQTLTKENMQRLREMYKVPINGKILGVPKVNPDIWTNLPHAIKQSDARYQFQQQYLSRAIVDQAEIADRLIKEGKTVPKEMSEYLLKATMDNATMIRVAQRELNAKRKAGIKSSVLPEYGAICFLACK